MKGGSLLAILKSTTLLQTKSFEKDEPRILIQVLVVSCISYLNY